MAKSSKNQIEQDEKKLLFELVKNSNENIDTIAKHCGFSRQKAWRMIKHLEDNNKIWGYTAVFDEQKIGHSHFIMFIKRTGEQVDEKTIEILISKKADDVAAEFGVTLENHALIHGEYDWIVTFTTKDIMHAKQFADKLMALYSHLAEKITIMQTLMFIRKNYVLNPERKKLKKFM